MATKRKCSLPGCGNMHNARGLCKTHYKSMKLAGELDRYPILGTSTLERLTRTGWDVTQSGCWEWRGARSGGYGHFSGDSGPRLAHRAMYELANGVIPEGLIICHRCDNPPCVNPEHLFAGTHQDNYDDMVAKGRRRFRGAPQLAMTS